MTAVLVLVLAYGLCVQWLDRRWAWGAEQIAILALSIGWLIAH
jgi:hypothetical protein